MRANIIRIIPITHIILIASFTQNRKLDPQHLTPVHAPSRVLITGSDLRASHIIESSWIYSSININETFSCLFIEFKAL
jgi:hypothetical protein